MHSISTRVQFTKKNNASVKTEVIVDIYTYNTFGRSVLNLIIMNQYPDKIARYTICILQIVLLNRKCFHFFLRKWIMSTETVQFLSFDFPRIRINWMNCYFNSTWCTSPTKSHNILETKYLRGKHQMLK